MGFGNSRAGRCQFRLQFPINFSSSLTSIIRLLGLIFNIGFSIGFGHRLDIIKSCHRQAITLAAILKCMRKTPLQQVFKLLILVSLVFKSLQLIVRIYNIIIINLFLTDKEKYRVKLSFIIQELKIETPVNYIITILFFIVLSI